MRKDKGYVELVKRKDTGMYLHYIYMISSWSHEEYMRLNTWGRCKETIKREWGEYEETSPTIWGTDWYNMKKVQGTVNLSQKWNEPLHIFELR